MNIVEPSPLTQKLVKSINRLDGKSNSSSVVYEYVFDSIRKRIKIEGDIDEKDKNFLVYTAVLEAIFNFDHSSSVRYVLQHGSVSDEKNIEHLVNSHYFKKICRFCRTQKLPYLIISDILESRKNDLKKLFADPEKLEEEAEKIYENRRRKVEERIYRRIIFATLLVFLVSFFSSLTLIDFSLSFKIIFFSIPPLLSSLLVFNFSSPPGRNKRRVVFTVMETLYKKKENISCSIVFTEGKKETARLLVNIFYAVGFLFVMAIILWCFDIAGLPPLPSAVLVVLFIFISFTGVRAKEISEDIYLVERKERIIDVIMDFFAFPIIKMRGFTLSQKNKPPRSSPPQPPSKASRKSLSVLLDGWIEELRKKKEKIYED